jgi:hypothetical protein
MKTQQIILCVCSLFFIMSNSGCGQSTEPPFTPTPNVPTAATSRVTLTPSFRPLPTASSTQTPTPTMVPTLPSEEARAELLQLLSNNGDCRLPCLWSIAPGRSSSQEAAAILAPLSSLSDFTSLFPSPGDISPSYLEGNVAIYTRIAYLYSENGVVNTITFNAEAHKPLAQGGYEDVFDSKFLGEKVSAYTLPHVLTEQGVPSSVMIETAGGPLTRGGRGGFDILLLYPDQGILVNYRTQMHLNGVNVRGCPANAYVQMELYPPGQPDSFFEGLKQTDWTVKMNVDYKPLEEVTSMSVQEFYDTFREPTDKCIETPAKLWPTPEP